jgi:hypothetical protein
VAGDGESGHPLLPLPPLLRPASCALPSSASRSRSAHRIDFLCPQSTFFILVLLFSFFFFSFFSFFVRGVSIERGKASAFWGFLGFVFLYGVAYITAVTASLRQKKTAVTAFFAAFFRTPFVFFRLVNRPRPRFFFL